MSEPLELRTDVQRLLDLARSNVATIPEALESGDVNAASETAFATEDVLADLAQALRMAA